MTKGSFKFEIIIHVLVSPFRFIWIPRCYYKYFTLPVRGSPIAVRIWRLLTSKVDPRAVRVKINLSFMVFMVISGVLLAAVLINSTHIQYVSFKISNSGQPHPPENTRRWTNAGLMLGQCRGRWANIKPTSNQPIKEWLSLSHDEISQSPPSFSCYLN